LPARMTALHHKHLHLGAKMVEQDGWLKPEAYGKNGDEVTGVRKSAGICDISPLGKIDIKGAAIDTFFEQAFGSASAARQPGEVRLVASGGGRDSLPGLYDCRLTRDHALRVTAPLPQLPSVLDVPSASNPFRAYVTNVTSVLAAINLAGPRSIEILEKLTQVDLSPAAFPGHACREGGVAKVPALIVRLDMSDEGQSVPAFDLFVGRDYAEYFWEALMEAGKEFGIQPFGVKAHAALHTLSAHDAPRARGRR